MHTANDHVWHMETLARICDADPDLLLATPFRVVDLTDKADQEKGIQWWEELTVSGGEGMVVKPLEFVTKGRKGLAQPAVKVRGREYLRIIYGPEYTLPEHLERLKSRGLGAKRSLALREIALGLEALERFVHEEPLRRVHECVFGVLALESEPLDPRLEDCAGGMARVSIFLKVRMCKPFRHADAFFVTLTYKTLTPPESPPSAITSGCYLFT